MHALETSRDNGRAPKVSAWGAVVCMSLLCFVLVASEFMPVSLLTPVAYELQITEGQAGQAIAISGLFAVLSSLFGNALLSRFDRRSVVILYTLVMIGSGLAVTLAPNYEVFMCGRALIGVAIGGFWSLTTAIIVRVVALSDVPKAIALLQGGTALAFVIAAPMGSFLGSVIGWRGAFFTVVPLGVIGLVCQFIAIPKLPPSRNVSVGQMLNLLRSPVFAFGMLATALAFMGQFSLSTYLRPFLENVTGLNVRMVSIYLFDVGFAGLIGTMLIGYVLRSYLLLAIVGLPAGMAVMATLLIVAGHNAVLTACALFIWGLLTTPIPVSWNTWMTRIIPNDLEAGGALQVALIQFAITAGAFAGGLLFDNAGWSSTFLLAVCLLMASSVVAFVVGRVTRIKS